MPKVPDFVQELMVANPELALEDAVARKVLGHCGANPATRKKIAYELRGDAEHSPRDWEVVRMLLIRKTRLSDVTAITTEDRKTLVDELDGQLSAAEDGLRRYPALVFFRFKSQQLIFAGLHLPHRDHTLAEINIPCQLLQSKHRSGTGVWVVYTLEVYLENLAGYDLLGEWLE